MSNKHIVKFTCVIANKQPGKREELLQKIDFQLDSDYKQGLTMRFASLMKIVLRTFFLPEEKADDEEYASEILYEGRKIGEMVWDTGDYFFSDDFLDELTEFKGAKGERIVLKIVEDFVKDDVEFDSEDLETSNEEEEEENLLEALSVSSNDSDEDISDSSSDDEEEAEQEGEEDDDEPKKKKKVAKRKASPAKPDAKKPPAKKSKKVQKKDSEYESSDEEKEEKEEKEKEGKEEDAE